MISRLSRLWREPLLHFMLLGAALFIYYDYASDGVEEAPNRIIVTAGQVEQLVANFKRTWSRPPTATELEHMIEGHVREEVFYREALAMGLDQDDPLVRRRLRMKLEFILEDLTSQQVSDEVLNDYLQRNAERFRREARLSFRQVFLDPEKHAALEADAKQLLTLLVNGADPATLGDPTLISAFYTSSRTSEIARDFGTEFAAELAQLETGKWLGPLYSPFGAHLLLIDERNESRLPSLEEVRAEVTREYVDEQRKLQKELVYQQLLDGYSVSVEPASDAGSNHSNTGASQ